MNDFTTDPCPACKPNTVCRTPSCGRLKGKRQEPVIENKQAEPVAVVGETFNLFWIGSEPVADIAMRHNIKVGTKLYVESPAVAQQPVGEVIEERMAPWCPPHASVKWFKNDFEIGTKFYTAPPAAAINEPFYSGFISGEQDWQVLKTAVDTWGEYEQVMMAIGDCGEFLTLMGRKVQGRLVESDMHDEIADVLIMMHQMANIYGIDHVRARVRHKMEKLAAKLNKAIAAAEADRNKGGG